VSSEVEAVHHVVEIPLDLRLFGEVLPPLPFLEELLGEEIGIRVALGVEPRPRIPVPVPGAPHAVARFEQLGGESGLQGAIELVDAGDTGTDNHHIDVAGQTVRVLVLCGSRGCHEPPRQSARQGGARAYRCAHHALLGCRQQTLYRPVER